MCPVVAVIWWLSILVIYFCNRVRHHCTDWCPVITRSMTITDIKHTMIMYKHTNKRSQSTAIIHKNTLPHAQIIMLYGFHDFIMLLLRLCIQRNKDPCRQAELRLFNHFMHKNQMKDLQEWDRRWSKPGRGKQIWQRGRQETKVLSMSKVQENQDPEFISRTKYGKELEHLTHKVPRQTV